MKRIAIIHTSLVSYNDLVALFAQYGPDIKLHHIIDDSLLAEVSAHGHVTPGVMRRMTSYVCNAADLGVDLIFNQCSSVGEAFEAALACVTTPGMRVDAPMAAEAVRLSSDGDTIGVVATVGSTVSPSVRVVERAIEAAGKRITVAPFLVDGALRILMEEKDRDRHDALVRQAIETACEACSAVCLAQGSMLPLWKQLHTQMPRPVLASPILAVQKAVSLLRKG